MNPVQLLLKENCCGFLRRVSSLTSNNKLGSCRSALNYLRSHNNSVSQLQSHFRICFLLRLQEKEKKKQSMFNECSAAFLFLQRQRPANVMSWISPLDFVVPWHIPPFYLIEKYNLNTPRPHTRLSLSSLLHLIPDPTRWLIDDRWMKGADSGSVRSGRRSESSSLSRQVRSGRSVQRWSCIQYLRPCMQLSALRVFSPLCSHSD